jgi:hypothetical protein
MPHARTQEDTRVTEMLPVFSTFATEADAEGAPKYLAWLEDALVPPPEDA